MHQNLEYIAVLVFSVKLLQMFVISKILKNKARRKAISKVLIKMFKSQI